MTRKEFTGDLVLVVKGKMEVDGGKTSIPNFFPNGSRVSGMRDFSITTFGHSSGIALLGQREGMEEAFLLGEGFLASPKILYRARKEANEGTCDLASAEPEERIVLRDRRKVCQS